MANIDNLRVLTSKEAREIGSKGGKASVEARRQKKSLREKAKLLMSLSIQDQKELLKAKELGLNEEEVDIEMMNLIHMLNIIKKENFNSVGAFNSLKDLTDEESNTNNTPELKIEIVNNEDLEAVMYSGDNKNE